MQASRPLNSAAIRRYSLAITKIVSPGIARIGYEELAPTPEMGQSFGLGFAVRTSTGNNPLSGSVGDYFWAGAYGTFFWIDPQSKMFAVMMVQMPFRSQATIAAPSASWSMRPWSADQEMWPRRS